VDSARPCDGIVTFEASSTEEARLLLERLEADRRAWLRCRKGAPLVSAWIRPEEGDLAVLLRTVEAWIEERGHVGIYFQLDGRAYVLWSAWAKNLWAARPMVAIAQPV